MESEKVEEIDEAEIKGKLKEVQQTLHKLFRHTIIKLLQTKDKEKCSKAAWRRKEKKKIQKGKR